MTHQIEIWNVSDLIPYEANAKKHPKEQIEKLATSITKFGWTQPIVVDGKGVIIAGHGRRMAALHLQLEKVPVLVRRDLSTAQADALRLADNRVTSTDYDQSMIQDELRRLSAELASTEITLADLGFDAKEIDFTMADLGTIDDNFFVDDVSEAVEKQKDENVQKLSETDETAAPVTDAFGFKRVTIAESRTLRGLMTDIETRSGKKGAEALIEALSAYANG
jgi:ParB-like chromosome segregation protein Spo0J